MIDLGIKGIKPFLRQANQMGDKVFSFIQTFQDNSDSFSGNSSLDNTLIMDFILHSSLASPCPQNPPLHRRRDVVY